MNKLRDPKYHKRIPYVNRRNENLLYFFRVYARVVYKAMIRERLSESYGVKLSRYRVELNHKKKETFDSIIKKIVIGFGTQAELEDIYGGFKYRKTKFIIIPKYFATYRRLRTKLYFFFRDFTESIIPYWFNRLKSMHRDDFLF